MNFEESRRHFVTDFHFNFNFDGVECKKGKIYFPRLHPENSGKLVFADATECEKWLTNFSKKLNIQPDDEIRKEIPDADPKPGDITDDDWKFMLAFIKSPDRVSKDDFRIYTQRVANNAMDRDRERFSLDVIRGFEKTLIGKSQLIGHQWGPPGVGVNYSVWIEEKSVNEAFAILQPNPNKKLMQHLDLVKERDGGIYFLYSKYYLLDVTTEEKAFNRRIDAGIIRSVSIGFKRVGIMPVTAKDSDDILFFEYKNSPDQMAEALEVSFVFQGSQFGAQVAKDAGADQEPKTIIAETKTESEDVTKAEWTAAYINSLEDDCFAVIEPGQDKDDDGKTVPRTARHLPHHAKGNGAAGTGGTVDMAHLRNALARMNQIKPVSDKITVEALRAKAMRHLMAHAKKEGIGDYENDEGKTIKLPGEIKMEFKAELIGITKDVNIEAIETEFAALAGDVDAKYKTLLDENAQIKTDNEALKNKVTDYDTIQNENEGLKKQVADLTAAKAEIESVFDGRLPKTEELKALKSHADKVFGDLIEETIKYAFMANMIAQEKANEMRENYRKMTVEQVTYWRDEFKKLYDAKPPLPQTPEPKITNEKKAVPEKSDARFIIN